MDAGIGVSCEPGAQDVGVEVGAVCDPDTQDVGVIVDVGVGSSSFAGSGVQTARPKATPSVNNESHSLFFSMM